MLAHKHMQTLETHTQKQPLEQRQQRHLIDISTATVDLIFSAWWRGTATENAANQPVSQSGYTCPCSGAVSERALRSRATAAQKVHQSCC